MSIIEPAAARKISTAIGKPVLAALAAGALLISATGAASADSWQRGHGWKAKRVVVVHKHRYHRPEPRRVVHVYHNAPKPRPPVRVVHHHYPSNYSNYPAHSPGGPGPVFTNRTGGLLIGGILGAVAGSQFGSGSGRVAALIGGTIVGAVIGGRIGQSMDREDHAHVQQTLETAPTGRSAKWTNPDTGAEYTVTPTRTYTANNRDCRDYDAWVFIDGYEQKVTGTACRLPDGTWQTVQS